MEHSRAHIRMETQLELVDFLRTLLQEQQNSGDTYLLEDFSGTQVISAASMLGLIYARSEWKETFLVNKTSGLIAAAFDKFRVLA